LFVFIYLTVVISECSIDCCLYLLQLQGAGSLEGVSSSSGNKSDLVTQCENLRDVVRKAEVKQVSAFYRFILNTCLQKNLLNLTVICGCTSMHN